MNDDLFGYISHNQNILPFDGEVNYFGRVFDVHKADAFYQALLHEIEWENDKAVIFGKTIVTKRKVAWYAQQPFNYTYSNVTKTARAFSPMLNAIRAQIEKESGDKYNACLLNLYHTGEEGMAWHSDNEKELKKNSAIASVSFGAERKFAFKHKQKKEVIALALQHGSLLVMRGETQKYWLHRLPPTKRVHSPRINLTFRTINA